MSNTYYIDCKQEKKNEIQVAKWGTPKKYLKTLESLEKKRKENINFKFKKA